MSLSGMIYMNRYVFTTDVFDQSGLQMLFNKGKVAL